MSAVGLHRIAPVPLSFCTVWDVLETEVLLSHILNLYSSPNVRDLHFTLIQNKSNYISVYFKCHILYILDEKSRNRSVGIATGYGLDGLGSIPGSVNFYLHHSVQTGSGAHPASYLVGTRGSFPRSKAAGS
jgi:hypothetical protein